MHLEGRRQGRGVSGLRWPCTGRSGHGVLARRRCHHRDQLDLANDAAFRRGKRLRTDDQTGAKANNSDWKTHGKPPENVISKS